MSRWIVSVVTSRCFFPRRGMNLVLTTTERHERPHYIAVMRGSQSEQGDFIPGAFCDNSGVNAHFTSACLSFSFAFGWVLPDSFSQSPRPTPFIRHQQEF
jgi:hypothetical protein